MSKLVQLKDTDGDVYPVIKPRLLWSGNFTSGSITVPKSSQYVLFLVYVGPVMCIGAKAWGGNNIGAYGSYAIGNYAYRFSGDGDTWIIDNVSRGGTNGTSQEPIRSIWGIF